MRKKFEYRSIEVKPKSMWTAVIDPIELDQTINKYGSDGWELVTVVPFSSNGVTNGFLFTFKREL